MKRSAGGTWCHLVCVLWTPELWLEGAALAPAGLDRLDPDRESLTCAVCLGHGGAAVQCAVPECLVAMHPFCARDTAGYLLEASEESYALYCKKHASRRRRELRLEAQSAGGGGGSGSSAVVRVKDDDGCHGSTAATAEAAAAAAIAAAGPEGRGRYGDVGWTMKPAIVDQDAVGFRVDDDEESPAVPPAPRGRGHRPHNRIVADDNEVDASGAVGSPAAPALVAADAPAPPRAVHAMGLPPAAAKDATALPQRARRASEGGTTLSAPGSAVKGGDDGGHALFTLSQAQSPLNGGRGAAQSQRKRLRRGAEGKENGGGGGTNSRATVKAKPAAAAPEAAVAAARVAAAAVARGKGQAGGGGGRVGKGRRPFGSAIMRFIDDEAEVEEGDASDDDEALVDEFFGSQDSFINDGDISVDTAADGLDDDNDEDEEVEATGGGGEAPGSGGSSATPRGRKQRRRLPLDDEGMYRRMHGRLVEDSPDAPLLRPRGAGGGSGRHLGFIAAVIAHHEEGGRPEDLEAAYREAGGGGMTQATAETPASESSDDNDDENGGDGGGQAWTQYSPIRPGLLRVADGERRGGGDGSDGKDGGAGDGRGSRAGKGGASASGGSKGGGGARGGDAAAKRSESAAPPPSRGAAVAGMRAAHDIARDSAPITRFPPGVKAQPRRCSSNDYAGGAGSGGSVGGGGAGAGGGGVAVHGGAQRSNPYARSRVAPAPASFSGASVGSAAQQSTPLPTNAYSQQQHPPSPPPRPQQTQPKEPPAAASLPAVAAASLVPSPASAVPAVPTDDCGAAVAAAAATAAAAAVTEEQRRRMEENRRRALQRLEEARRSKQLQQQQQQQHPLPLLQQGAAGARAGAGPEPAVAGSGRLQQSPPLLLPPRAAGSFTLAVNFGDEDSGDDDSGGSAPTVKSGHGGCSAPAAGIRQPVPPPAVSAPSPAPPQEQSGPLLAATVAAAMAAAGPRRLLQLAPPPRRSDLSSMTLPVAPRHVQSAFGAALRAETGCAVDGSSPLEHDVIDAVAGVQLAVCIRTRTAFVQEVESRAIMPVLAAVLQYYGGVAILVVPDEKAGGCGAAATALRTSAGRPPAQPVNDARYRMAYSVAAAVEGVRVMSIAAGDLRTAARTLAGLVWGEDEKGLGLRRPSSSPVSTGGGSSSGGAVAGAGTGGAAGLTPVQRKAADLLRHAPGLSLVAALRLVDAFRGRKLNDIVRSTEVELRAAVPGLTAARAYAILQFWKQWGFGGGDTPAAVTLRRR
ncbi:unnamed protein product [Phaeothamnion confervicola]